MLADELLRKCKVVIENAIFERRQADLHGLLHHVSEYLAEFAQPVEEVKPLTDHTPGGFTLREQEIIDRFRLKLDRSIHAYDRRLWRGVIKAFIHSRKIREDIVVLFSFVGVNDMADTLEDSLIWDRIQGWNERNGDQYAG